MRSATSTDQHTDLFTLIESRLFEGRLQALMIPTSRPVDGPIGSGFGFRSDPFSGAPALHTGLDFPADIGTPILAAAGGVVLATEYHPAYGHVLEIDHGNGLVTRYAHTSKMLVKPGDLVKRGQTIAEVGNLGPLDRAAPALRGAGRRRAAGPGQVPRRRARRHGAAGFTRPPNARTPLNAAWQPARLHFRLGCKIRRFCAQAAACKTAACSQFPRSAAAACMTPASRACGPHSRCG